MVHEYFKREFDDFTIIVQLNPESFAGQELTIHSNGEVERRKMKFDKDIYEDFEADEFEKTEPLEFNLYLKGLV